MNTLPITVYIIKNTDIDWESDDNSNSNIKLTDYITQDNIKTIVNENNTHFFKNHLIELDLKDIIEYTYDGNLDTLSQNMNSIKREDEDENIVGRIISTANNNYREQLYQSLIPNNKVSNDSINIYFVSFIGNTRQGYAGVNRNMKKGYCTVSNKKFQYPIIIIGTWSNKQSGKNNFPEKRRITHKEGCPSLSFTFGHEITHILGLYHLNTNVDNIMNSMTSSFFITDEQRITIQTATQKYLQNNSCTHATALEVAARAAKVDVWEAQVAAEAKVAAEAAEVAALAKAAKAKKQLKWIIPVSVVSALLLLFIVFKVVRRRTRKSSSRKNSKK
jgi:hypothetical protein